MRHLLARWPPRFLRTPEAARCRMRGDRREGQDMLVSERRWSCGPLASVPKRASHSLMGERPAILIERFTAAKQHNLRGVIYCDATQDRCRRPVSPCPRGAGCVGPGNCTPFRLAVRPGYYGNLDPVRPAPDRDVPTDGWRSHGRGSRLSAAATRTAAAGRLSNHTDNGSTPWCRSGNHGGLILSQALTLNTTPVVFMYLERVNRWLSGCSRKIGSGAGLSSAATEQSSAE
jgi:hypothetical protein